MRALIFVFFCFMISLPTFADDTTTTVNKNVIVIPSGMPGQCTASWRGTAEATVDQATPAGQVQMGSAGTRSCTGCGLDANQNCVCDTCYDYFD